MSNSDYTFRSSSSGFCPSASIVAAVDPLTTSVTMSGYTSPIPNGIRIGMAALIDNEIVSVLAQSGNLLTLGRGCCDTVPASHAAGATIWFFDDSFGNDGTEYGSTETISVKLMPRTLSGGSVPIANAPPNGLTFNWRFYRPYPPALLLVNGDPWFQGKTLTQEGVSSLALAWVHRNRVTQMDQLVDHMQGSISPEVGTTYRVEVRKADNTLIHSTAGITGTSWTRTRADLITDFGVTGGTHLGYINVVSVRDGYDSYQGYRIDFTLNASNPVSSDLALSYAIATPVSADLALSYAIQAGAVTPSYTTFSGVDPNGTATILASVPNSVAAETSFKSTISGFVTENFETQTLGVVAPLTLSLGALGTVTLSSGNGKVSDNASSGMFGRYSVPSGTKFWDVRAGSTGNFVITFSQDMAAFGFYGVDVGENVSGVMSLELMNSSGVLIKTQAVTSAAAAGADGSTLYFAIKANNSASYFRSIRFITATGVNDVFGFDSFTVAAP